MKDKFTKYLPYFLVLLLGYGITYWFYAPMLLHPATYLSAQGGDGIKNYFTFAYHLRYGTGWQFSGMNYPFGDLILFSDNHPALAFILSALRNTFPSLADNPAAIINILMVYTMPFCGVFLYSILCRFQLPVVWAVVGSLLLAYLSPQLMRIGGHMSLSYTFFVPMLWWLILKLQDTETTLKKVAWGGFITSFLVFWGYIHLYYLFIGSLFVMTYAVMAAAERFIQEKNNADFTIKTAYKTIMAAALPLFGVATAALSMAVTSINRLDTLDDRVKVPWGFFNYYANFSSVFYPSSGSWHDTLMRLHAPFIQEPSYGNMEGTVYVGFWGIWVLLGTIIVLGHRFYTKKTTLTLPPALQTALYAAVILLLFSFCIPFKYLPASIPEKIPYLEQFRSLGRFAWCFYYVFGVYTVYFLYNILSQIVFFKNKPIAVYAAGLVIAFLWAKDVKTYLKTNTSSIFNKTDIFSAQKGKKFTSLLGIEKRKPDEFQAILSFPFYHIGSEKIWQNGSYQSVQQSFECAFETGLPIIDVMTSRTSLKQLLSTNQIVADSLVAKDFFASLPNKKPILLIRCFDAPLKPGEEYLINHYTRKITEVKDEYILYELFSGADFGRPQRSVTKAFRAMQASQKTPILKNTPEAIEIVGFDDCIYLSPLRGKGAKGWTGQEDNNIYEKDLVLKADSVKMSVSMWVRATPDRCCMPTMTVKVDNTDGSITKKEVHYKEATTTDVRGWMYQSVDIMVHKSKPKLRVTLSGYFEAIDELWIRPAAATVFDNTKNDTKNVVCNNFDVKLE